jgi:hypothetical protein
MPGEAEGKKKDKVEDAYQAYVDAILHNFKRTIDEYQQESLETIRQQRTLFSKILTDAQQYDNQRQVIANKALQDAAENNNMMAKQAIRHGDIAIDRQWNLDEQTWAAATKSVGFDAFIVLLAKAVAEVLEKKNA